MNENEEQETREINIMELPEEIVEYILGLLSPYSDFQAARLVCKLWQKIMAGVVKQTHSNFLHSMYEGFIDWSSMDPEYGSMISERYSHAACYHDKSIYIFGGCTSTSTTFNDLWRFDLNRRIWIRPLAIGTYPSPKACATLVSYKDNMILFGGWSHPTPTPLHQPNNFFSELHVYSPHTNNWNLVMPQPTRSSEQNEPKGRAGHAASVVGDLMIVFGGSRAYGTKCDDVWVLDLIHMRWALVGIAGARPRPRFGHSQIVMDQQHLLVVGGCAGPNMQFHDVWLLKMGPGDWTWREIKVTGTEFSPPKLWCHPACRVGDKIIILSKLSSRSPRINPDTPNGNTFINVLRPASASIENGRKSLPKRRLPETSESSSQESSSDGEERNISQRKTFGPASSSNKMSAFKVNTEGDVPTQGQAAMETDNGLSGGQPASENQAGPSGLSGQLGKLPGSADRGASSERLFVDIDPLPSTSSQSPPLPLHSPRSPPSPSRFVRSLSPNSPHTLPVRDGMPSIRPNAMKNRLKQLEALRRHEERIRSKTFHPPSNPPIFAGGAIPKPADNTNSGGNTQYFQLVQNPMYVHALDISRAVSDEEVRWHNVTDEFTGVPPEEKMFYSLSHARGELIMFGGIKTEANAMNMTGGASNTTYILKAKPKTLR